MRFFAGCFAIILWSFSVAFAQQDTTAASADTPNYRHSNIKGNSLLDSVANAMQARKLFVADSINMRYIRIPDSTTRSEFTDSLFAHVLYRSYGFLDIHLKNKSKVKDGLPRPSRDPCILLY
jgi:hypothetical protein